MVSSMKSSEIRDGNLDLFGDVLGKKINLQFSDGQVKVVPVSAEINPNINNLIANLNQLLEIEPLGKNKYAIKSNSIKSFVLFTVALQSM